MHGQGPFEYNECMSRKTAPGKTNPDHKKGWKFHQGASKLKKKTKLGIWALIFLVTIIALGQFINFGRMLFRPWNPQNIGKNYNWDRRFNINLVVKAKSIAVFSLNPTEKQVKVINFPDNTMVNVAGGFGNWQLGAIYGLGQSEGIGWDLLERTMSSFLGIPIDGYLEFKGDLAKKDPFYLIQKLNQDFTSGILDIKKIQSDLTLLDLARLKFYLGGIRFDRIENIDLGNRGILDQNQLNDGTPIYNADEVKIDSALTFFIDPNFKTEHITIAVLNGTNHPLIAQKAARLITNMGGDVIIISNTEKSYPKTQVTGEKSATLTRLRQMFDYGKISSNILDVENSRAQINIVLGEDFYMRQ